MVATTPILSGFSHMPSRKAESDSKKGPPTTNVKVRVEAAKQIADIAEARGWPQWKVMDDLLAAELPAAHAAAQPALKEIRKQKARIAAIQEQARQKAEE